MKKILFIIGLFFCVQAHSQVIDSISNGESGSSVRTKLNQVIAQVNDTIAADSVVFNYKTGSLTDGTPTASEINAILGTPSSKDAGWTARIKDSDGTGLIYYLINDGTDWYWIISTKAL